MRDRSTRSAIFLQEMGLGPIWMRRDSEVMAESSSTHPTVTQDEIAQAPVRREEWADRGPGSLAPNPPGVRATVAGTSPSAAEIGQMDMLQLRDAVANCTKCGLCKGRTKTVFGVGDEKAKWLFIGEGPGRNEDAQGEPFVGPAGKLLDNMLLAIGLKRGENAYIANIVKCRPTDANGRDRPPTQEETAACMPYLERQIALIQPNIIVALGKSAALGLLNLDANVAVSSLRGKLHRYAGLPLLVTYHPAYLLRTPVDKRKAWADLCLAVDTYADAGR